MDELTVARIIHKSAVRRNHYLGETGRRARGSSLGSSENARLMRCAIEEVLEIMVTELGPDEYVRLLKLAEEEADGRS